MRRRERGDLEEDDVPGLEGLLPGLATALHQSQQMRQVQHNLMFKIKSQPQRGFLEEGCFNSRGNTRLERSSGCNAANDQATPPPQSCATFRTIFNA